MPSKNGNQYHSLELPLSAIEFDKMYSVAKGSDEVSLFRNQVLGYLEHLRNHPMYRQNPEHQKAQFIFSYQEIMGKLYKKVFLTQRTKEWYDMVT